MKGIRLCWLVAFFAPQTRGNSIPYSHNRSPLPPSLTPESFDLIVKLGGETSLVACSQSEATMLGLDMDASEEEIANARAENWLVYQRAQSARAVAGFRQKRSKRGTRNSPLRGIISIEPQVGRINTRDGIMYGAKQQRILIAE
jgi:hypothetical protein